MSIAACLSSATVEWSTPRAIFDKLNAEFGPFTLDPCSTHENAKCAKHFTIEDDGLAQSWADETVFMNPPYGRTLGKWMKKAHDESKRGARVVCLIPARTDTAWWHDHCEKADAIRFVRGRIRFEGGAHAAPFPSAIIVFERAKRKRIYLASPYSGTLVQREERTRLVRMATAAILGHGFNVYSPISHGHDLPLPPEVAASDDFWRPLNEDEIDQSDELWVLKIDGWRESKGVSREIEYAGKTGKPVLHIDMDHGRIADAIMSAAFKGGRP